MDLEDNLKLYCGNISPNVNEAILYELFMQAGPIHSLNMPKKDNEHRGFAFIEFRHECAVQYAVDLFDGLELAGRTLTIQNKSRRAQRPPDIYDVLGSPLEVPFGPIRNNMDAPMLSLPPKWQHNPTTSSSYSNHFPNHGPPPMYSRYEQQGSHNNFEGKPYQRYHSTDRNRSDRTNADRNRGYEPDRNRHSDRQRHSDRRYSDNHSDRNAGIHSQRSTHSRFNNYN